MATDGWTTDDLVFQWKKENPVQVAKNMHLPRFILEKFQTDLCNSITNTGTSITFRSSIIDPAIVVAFAAGNEATDCRRLP